ncbi:MAG: polysaccharide biosynthesis tyrosine autokinase [Oscillospiraceae bacterium]|nr:polysaccharide biosynthesis tyrosine autokinase [Oscillospiraceae bacterium]
MNENKILEKEEMEIDFKRVIGALLKKWWLVAASSVLCALLTFLFTFFVITPKYTSSVLFYVNNGSFSIGGTDVRLGSTDILASQDLAESYMVILQSRTTLLDVIDYAQVDRDYEELRDDMLKAESVNGTEIFRVSITSEDPYEAEKIANSVAYILPKRISTIIEGTSAKIVDAAIVETEPSSPSYVGNTLVGFAFGFIICVGVIALRVIFDLTVREEDDIKQVCKHPILTQVPDMTAPSKGGYYTKESKKKIAAAAGPLFGENISFAASEAYKLLRTKIQFSFADENDCHVICTTSALAGEGKSLSSVNLAYSLAQLDKKVVLIDCDLRRPSIAAKIGIEKDPGLSDYLTRHVHSDEIIQEIHVGEGIPFDVVAAGRIPPNPMELLSSARMEKIINKYKEDYDYIILDLPPIEEVGDALVAAKLADGVLLVVRQNYGNRLAVENTLKQLEFVNAKVLGVVFNATSESGGGKYYSKKYYGQGKYENSYEKAASREQAKKQSGEHKKRAKTRDDD